MHFAVSQALGHPPGPTLSFSAAIERALAVSSCDVPTRVAELFAGVPEAEALDAIAAALPFCQRLHGEGRSFDAIPLATACVDLAGRQAASRIAWQASTAAGILLGDTGDYAGALQYHSRAMRLAEGRADKIDLARSWNNAGLVFLVAGSYDLANECFFRTTEIVGTEPCSALYMAFMNIAQCELHLGGRGNLRTGLIAAHEALRCETSVYVEANPYVAVLLRAVYARLLARAGRNGKAERAAAEATQLALRYPSARGQLTAGVAGAAVDVAGGRAAEGLRKLHGQLPAARRIPAVLVDVLSTLAQAELMMCRPDRAEVHLQELNDLVYEQAAQQARQHLQLAMNGPRPAAGRYSAADRWNPMLEWDALERLAVRADMHAQGDVWRSTRVGDLVRLLAMEFGYDEPFATEIGLASRLHDIGMMAIAAPVPQSSRPLTETGEALLRRHVLHGGDLLRQSTHPRAILAAGIARYHHERWDGTGYPEGLRGEGIPPAARMCAIADAFEQAIRHDCTDLGITRAAEKIRAGAGTQFEPTLAHAFDRSLRDGFIHHYLESDGSRYPTQTLDLDSIMKRFAHQ